ncbi:two-component sensor histidine kinase [Flavobacterium crocinum]|uniref:histidine kinase n=1 Tax=Flavobacterium crocinum TaxID=2183896 RepID=A0A2S1YJJ3_9FLAO|nr:HAMP domain-containing sensor histidine kinase [Flavobacterium crocinum]AWK04239.1 two-component sensor histidine kinase [Flavobacterium crocinum]
MSFSERTNTTRWIIISICFLIISLILWNTYTFFQIFKNEERLKMKLFVNAQITILNANENTDVELPLQIINNNTSIPAVVILFDKVVSATNVPDEVLKDKKKRNSYLNRLRNENEPITFEYAPGKYQTLYYGNSGLLNKLKYYPIALFLIIVLCVALIYNFYKSTKMATQNKLWAGMAKETAHQIGTPLSSLIGWVEILKTEDIDPSISLEIEKDIERLQTITDRFSKIGSIPVLEPRNIIEETKNAYEYLQSRFSKQVAFSFKAPAEPIYVMINPTLHSWTIENLVKNAIDAMKGRGTLDLQIEQDAFNIKINIKDSGTGILKKQFKTIFEPGFTTKKRGWGLGLSLTKRIVEEYHNGKIKVLSSELGKGTTFQVSFNKKVQ